MKAVITRKGFLEIQFNNGIIRFTNFEINDEYAWYALVHANVSSRIKDTYIDEKIKTISKPDLSNIKAQIKKVIGKTNIDNIKKIIHPYVNEKGLIKKEDFIKILPEIEKLEEVKDMNKTKQRKSKKKINEV